MAKYIKRFETETEFLEFKNSNEFTNDTISYVLEDGSVWYGSKKRLPSEVEEMVDKVINNIINTSV